MAHLADSRYGKSTVRLVAVDRSGDTHRLKDLTVEIAFRGDYEAAHVAGDNRHVYPTDSMKNSVYILARKHGVGEIEEFAARLARHYLSRPTPPRRVEIEIQEHPWNRLEVAGEAHPHAFSSGGAERRIARCELDQEGRESFAAGIEGLMVLKTTGSGFESFPRDECTTLPETADRIFATVIEASWRYVARPRDFGAAHAVVRQHLLEAFALHDSRSVQHTLFAMGERVLAHVPEIDEIELRLPNRHHLLANLQPFGLDNPNLVFVATSEPFGDIRGVVRR